MNIFEGTLERVAKLIAKWKFEQTLKQIQKELARDPEVQQATQELKVKYEDLKTRIENLCIRNPKHHLCKDYKYDPKK